MTATRSTAHRALCKHRVIATGDTEVIIAGVAPGNFAFVDPVAVRTQSESSDLGCGSIAFDDGRRITPLVRKAAFDTAGAGPLLFNQPVVFVEGDSQDLRARADVR